MNTIITPLGKVLASVCFLCCFHSCTTNTEVRKNSKQASLDNPITLEPYRKAIAVPQNHESASFDTLSILSWNVEHFVDQHDNPYTRNKRENNPEEAESRAALLIEALKKADADIVVLQEFEHIQFLKQLAEDSLSDMGYQFFADQESINWYMNVVVMSRVPLGITYGYGNVHTPVNYVDEESNEDKYETQSRINTRLWSVDVLVNEQYSFLLTGVHLKAGRGARNIAMRKGQLAFLKGQYERFLKENPNRNILMVGDFNATPDSEEIQVLLEADAPTRFVDNLDETIFTHPSDDPKWRIDYILPNTNMQSELVAHSMGVQYYFDTLTQRKLSDHLPVFAAFVAKDH